MGSLILPQAGEVYFDANAFIYSVERIEPYRSLLDPAWQAAQTGRIHIVSTELVLLETLVKPLRDANTALKALFRALFASPEVRLVPVTAATWDRAARLRASANINTPGSIHAACALAESCSLFVTNDTTFTRVPGLQVALLSECA